MASTSSSPHVADVGAAAVIAPPTPFTDAEAFLDALSPRAPMWRAGRWCYRGHGDARWRLVPNALRPDAHLDFAPGAPPGPRATWGEQVAAEAKLVLDFLDQANEQGIALPHAAEELIAEDAGATLERLRRSASWDMWDDSLLPAELWPFDEVTPLLALAQHAGIATRLLDWTRDARVAAYFAAERAARWVTGAEPAPTGGAASAPPSHLEVWALEREALGRLMARPAQRPDAPNGPTPPGEAVRLVNALAAQNVTLHAQRGLFTVVVRSQVVDADPVAVAPLDDVVVRAAQARAAVDISATGIAPEVVCRRLTLSLGEAPRLLRLLALEGVTAASIYPGLSGVAAALAERRLWDRDAPPAAAVPDRPPLQ